MENLWHPVYRGIAQKRGDLGPEWSGLHANNLWSSRQVNRGWTAYHEGHPNLTARGAIAEGFQRPCARPGWSREDCAGRSDPPRLARREGLGVRISLGSTSAPGVHQAGEDVSRRDTRRGAEVRREEKSATLELTSILFDVFSLRNSALLRVKSRLAGNGHHVQGTGACGRQADAILSRRGHRERGDHGKGS